MPPEFDSGRAWAYNRPMTQKTRRELIAALENSQAELQRLLESMASVQDWQREPAEWSFRLLAAHLATVERECHLPRLRSIATGEQPRLAGYSHTGLALATRDLHDSLADWAEARRALLAFVTELPADRLTLTGIHADVGAITLLEVLEELALQDQGHIRYVRQLIQDFYDDQLPAPIYFDQRFAVN